eukprot:scaffold3852_cov293-Pinguiococcus_pyrenoidosus.AAC.1
MPAFNSSRYCSGVGKGSARAELCRAPDWGDTGSLAADATAACGEAAPPAAGAGATGGDSLSATCHSQRLILVACEI